MITYSTSIFQSGQQVPFNATYEVVGLKPATDQKKEGAIRNLQIGEFFPSYEGWEVCWHFTGEEMARQREESLCHVGTGKHTHAEL